MDFSRDGSKGYKVPNVFTFGTCKIAIDMNTKVDVVEKSSFGQIAIRSKEIIRSCVMNGYHLGGRSTIGDDDLIGITVTGQIFEKGEEPAGLASWAAAAAGVGLPGTCRS